MLKTILLIGIGAVGTYIAYQMWPGKMPMPCPCGSNTQPALTSSSGTTPQIQPAVYTTMPVVRPVQGGYA